jgi:trehalose 6-phosphate synthase
LKTPQAKALDDKLVADNIFINFERCDYSKGIIPRVRAFEEMLKKRPELRGKTQLVLGAEPTRGDIAEYRHYADEVKLMVERLNGNTDLWCEGVPPVIFSNENINHDDVIRLMRNRKEGQRRVGLITPHEDGMNLTAKEFAAAQDPGNAGPLVISSGAGAAAELDCGGKGAIVYPKIKNGGVGALADAMVRAVYMTQDEADARAVTMQEHLKKNDIQKWANYHRDIMERIQKGTFTQPRPAARTAAPQYPILAAE